jgi:trk system potassium uptake protein TrkA
MAGKKRTVVIGMNTFGQALMRSLIAHGVDCLGIDNNRERVQRASAEFRSLLEADATSADALEAAGVREYDVAVVAMASDLASSILTTLTLKHLGIRTIAAKCRSELHAEALKRVGADVTIFPESDSAERLAQMLVFSGLTDIRVITDGFCLARAPVLESMVGTPVRKAHLRAQFDLNIVLIEHRDGSKSVPHPDYLLQSDDVLYLVGWEKALGQYSQAVDKEHAGRGR